MNRPPRYFVIDMVAETPQVLISGIDAISCGLHALSD